MRTLIASVLGTSLALTSACVLEDDPACSGGKCDGLGDFGSKLEGRNDPIGKLLNDLDDEDGVMVGDLGALAVSLAKSSGCAADSWRSYVISDPLVEGTAFPRVIAAMCADDPTRASEAFISFSFKNSATGDIDTRSLELFGWDAPAGVYRFYATEAVGDKEIKFDIEPERCQECHLTPSDLAPGGMRMTPIMNELTQPWSHWNSQIPMFNAEQSPFPSHDFELPQEVREQPNFKRFGRAIAGAAAEFEQIIRSGHARVTGERAKERRNTAPDWKPAMNFLRPMFCEEQVQYVTEDFNSGSLGITAVIPGGIREAYRAVRPDGWTWQWLNNQDGRMRLASPAQVPAIQMMPIRGNVDIDFETRLVGVRALTPQQILRIRALDWKHPVFSALRCGLWRDALARFEAKAPTLNLAGRIADHIKVLYDLILSVDGVLLTTGSDATFIALDSATSSSKAALVAAVKNGALSTTCAAGKPCAVSLESFGAQLDAHVRSFEEAGADAARTRLVKLRDAGLCHVEQRFPNAPSLPSGVKCN